MDSYFTLQSNIEASGEFVDRKSQMCIRDRIEVTPLPSEKKDEETDAE